ncbi:hypothetical protein, partial [Vibrio parahaemolyticus]
MARDFNSQSKKQANAI